MNCPKCGKEIQDVSTKFCPRCGTALDGAPHAQQGFNVRMMMFIISAISAITALIVYMYGHDFFYDDVWLSSAPSFEFWEYGNGPIVFLFLVMIAIGAFIIGLCCAKKK